MVWLSNKGKLISGGAAVSLINQIRFGAASASFLSAGRRKCDSEALGRELTTGGINNWIGVHHLQMFLCFSVCSCLQI